ncbi:hypothetical protein [Luedemannella helvata]
MSSSLLEQWVSNGEPATRAATAHNSRDLHKPPRGRGSRLI